MWHEISKIKNQKTPTLLSHKGDGISEKNTQDNKGVNESTKKYKF